MKERDFQTMFTRYIRENPPEETCAFELKIVKKGAMPFNAVAEHQVEALIRARCDKGSYHKLSDMSREKKPYDCFYIRDARAYVVIWWYKPRQPKEMIWVPVEKFIGEMQSCKRKSLTEERAKEIGIVIPFK